MVSQLEDLLLAVLAIVTSLLAIGCRERVPLTTSELERLAERRSRPEDVTSKEGERSNLARDRDPVVTIAWRSTCQPPPAWPFVHCIAEARLADVTLDDGQLHVASARRVDRSFLIPHRADVTVDLDRLETAELRIKSEIPDFSPSWGVGGMLGGPGLLVSLVGSFFPGEWISIDAGATVTAPQIVGFGGVALRPFELGIVRPFVGGAASAGIVGESAEGPGTTALAGPRVGLDIAPNRSRLLVRIETDLLYRLDGGLAPFVTQTGRWLPWGGISLVRVF